MHNDNLIIIEHLNIIVSYLKEQSCLLNYIYEKLSMPIQNNWENKFLTVNKAAKLLDKNPSTVRRWITSGKLKAIKLNNGRKQDHYLISKDDINFMIHEAGGNVAIY